MFYFKLVAFLCLFFVFDCDANGVPIITPCKVDDNPCVMSSTLKAFQAVVGGMPEYKIPSADPLVLNDVNGDNGALKLKFKNLKVHGIKECKLEKIERQGKSKAFLIMECPIKAVGQYTLGGKLLVVDIAGEGNCEIRTDKIRIEVHIELREVEGDDGFQHYKIKKFNYKYTPIERFYFKLDNLFNGDPKLAEPVQKVLDDNWAVMITEVGKPVIEELIRAGVNVVDSAFAAWAIKDIVIQ